MRRCSTVLVASLLLLAASVCRAQGFTVSGRVVDAVTGSPLGRATVAIESTADGAAASPGSDPTAEARTGARQSRGSALADVTTGANGGFQFSGVPAGRYQLQASRRGYLAANLDQHGGYFAAVVVGAGKPTSELQFPLLPLGHITGTVLDSSGDPVTGAQVRLFTKASDGTGAIRSTRSAQTGQSSRYSFDNLAPGTYYVLVTGRPWFASSPAPGDESGPLDVAYAPTFFDGGTTSAEAQPIALAAGGAAIANVTLHAVPAVHVQLSVEQGGASRDSLAVPAFGGAVPLYAMGGVFQQGGAEGYLSMTLTVAPGAYVLQQGASRTPLAVSGDTQLASGSENPGVKVAGRLAMADGSALPAGASLLLTPASEAAGGFADDLPGRPGGMRRRPGQFSNGRMPITFNLPLKPDGTFTSDALLPGDYRFVLDGVRGLEVTGAAASGATISDDLLLHVASDPVMVAATVSAAAASLSGVAVDGRGIPEAGAMILLVPANGSAVLFRQDESDSDGTWTVRGVVKGQYHALAIRDGWDLKWKDRAVIARYLAGAVDATVSASGDLMLPTPLLIQAR